MQFLQCNLDCRSPECGVRSDTQGAQEGQRGGLHGSGGRCQGQDCHPGRRHGRHMRHDCACCGSFGGGWGHQGGFGLILI